MSSWSQHAAPSRSSPIRMKETIFWYPQSDAFPGRQWGYSGTKRHQDSVLLSTTKRASEDKREFTFATNQRWAPVPGSYSFVDETREIIGIHEAEKSDPEFDNDANTNSAFAEDRYASNQSLEETDEDALSVNAPNDLSPTASRYSYTVEDATSGRSKRPSNFELPRRKRTTCSVSSTGTTALSNTGDVTKLLAQASVNEQVLQPLNAATDPSMGAFDSLGLEQLLDASKLLDSPSYDPAFVESPIAQIGYLPFWTNEEHQPSSAPHGQQSRWPLKDSHEAYLFRYFVREVAPLFDLCDSLRHFARVVPKRAASCPPLLNAILAAAAKRLSRIGDVDGFTVDRYYHECLRALIPSLSRATAVKDEGLLAATVILRWLEETDIPFSTASSQSHLIGTRVFLAAQEDSGGFSGLRLALFWVALRQDIFMAFIHSRPVHPSLLNKNIAPVLEAVADDCSYANKVILHCAYCIQYCFGVQEQRPSLWTELNSYLEQWNENKPWCFQSMVPEEADGSKFFPDITYISDEVLTGMQHYYLARLVLEAHNPETPRLGPARREALEAVNQRIKKLVRIICGSAEARYVNAAISIVMAGDRFTDRLEQEVLYNLLVKIETQAAWPTGAA
ncbi:hypothetical protein TruAng_001236 [Truncatella angustata]|nr:hypothetical protein TruAng_001236 [Truncatella angustata]